MIYTEKIIKDAFWELLEEKPYNKITVQNIADRCQLNRNTFYYHFEDIPMLMTDSIEDWMKDVIKRYGNLASPVDCLTYMASECMKRKKAFLHLFRGIQNDMFLAKMNEMAYDIIYAYIDKVGKYDHISEEKRNLLIKSYKCLFTGSLFDWLEEGAAYDLAEFYRKICKMFAGSGVRIVYET